MNLKTFFTELKRRNVYKVAVAYAIVGWLLVQIATQVFPFLEIPNWVVRLVIALVAIGFPIALVIAWAFEATPEGIKRTEVADTMPATAGQKKHAWIYVAIVAGIIAISIPFFLKRAPKSTSTPPAPTASAVTPAPAKSIAVLAFTNLSDDKANEYFSDGISEELGNVLGRVPGLRVSGRNSAFYFKGKNATAQEIGQKLNVAYVVTGSVRKLGDQVRITAQLISTTDGFQVWSSESLTRELKDIFALQDEIAGVIAQNLKLKLDNTSRTTKTVNPEAHRFLLEGRHFWYLRTREGFARAEAAYTKALEIDPQFAEAHAGRANNFQIRGQYRILDGLGGEAEDQRRALEEAQTAIRLDPSLPEAYAAYGYLLHNQGELTEADRYYQKAFALNPNYAIAHLWHCQLLDVRGQLDAAVEENRLAYELDPLAFIIVDRYAQHLAMARRFKEALTMNERAAALRTDNWMPNLGERAMMLVALGRTKEAIEIARLVRQNPSSWPRWTADADAVWALRRCGLSQEADDYVTQLLPTLPEQSYVRGWLLANGGRFDEALPYLGRTPVIFRRNLFWGQNWDDWREDPRFLQLMSKLGFANEYKMARETLSRILAEQGTKK